MTKAIRQGSLPLLRRPDPGVGIVIVFPNVGKHIGERTKAFWAGIYGEGAVGRRSNTGNFGTLTAIRRASSFVMRSVADRRCRSV
jgi:hypothetical protein